jgi:hypothetical protein
MLDEATILAIDSHKFSRKMRESIEIEKHNTIDQEGKPLDSTWRALFKVTGHPFWRFAENRYCALNISLIFIKFSPNVLQCMQNMVKL